MLTEIRVQNTRRAELPELELPLFNPGSFPVVFVDGLNPVKAELSSSPYANLPGEYYLNSRVGKRNIVLTLGLNPSYFQGEDAEALRKHLRNWFNPQNPVRIEVVTTDKTLQIEGIVETFESPLFVQDPQVQVSIICHDPYFRAMLPKSINHSGPSWDTFEVVNEGDVSIGFELYVNPGGTVGDGDFRITNETVGGVLSVNHNWNSTPGGPTVYMNSTPREKQLIAGTNTQLIGNLHRGFVWPVLAPGPNVLGVVFDGGVMGGYLSIGGAFSERFSGI